MRVIDPDRQDRERKKRERLRLELHGASGPLNPGGELPKEAKKLIRQYVKDARQRQTWHSRNNSEGIPDDLFLHQTDFEPEI